MSTVPASFRGDPWFRPKYLIFAFVALMVAYVLRHNESFLINPEHPAWQHYQPFKWYLLPHGIAGACALLLGPMQIFGPAQETIHETSSRRRTHLCGGSVCGRAAGFLHPVFRRADGSNAIVQHGGGGGRGVVDDYDGDRVCVHSERQSAAAPTMDGPQLRGRLCVS